MGELGRLWQARASDPMFKFRDASYGMLDSYSRGRPKGRNKGTGPMYGYPFLFDIDRAAENKLIVNQTRQVINHFTAMFSETPRTWNIPAAGEESARKAADKLTALIRSTFRRSNLAMRQPQQSRWLSVRGDAVYGVEWDELKGKIVIRGWDPAWCYPSLDEIDLGAMHDLLITYPADRKWVEQAYGQKVPGRDPIARVYMYWTPTRKVTEIDDTRIEAHSYKHDLGFVPLRWCFADGAGDMGMSDVGDMLPLQDAYNEITAMMMKALRMTINPAWYGSGLKENMTPKPGQVAAIPPDAKINQFPLSEPPQVAMSVLDHVLQDIARVSGVSPISLEGMASGSIVTGRAVRNQVEAIEARAKTRRISLEATYSRMGEIILRILEQKFPKTEMIYRGVGGGFGSVRGEEVRGWWECEAEYGETKSMGLVQRADLAMQGVGKIWGVRTAIKLAAIEDETDPSDVMKEIEDYQMGQAVLTARAQAAAQHVAQEAQPPPPGQPQQQPGVQPPQTPQQHPAPTAGNFMVDLGHIEQSLKLIESGLKGSVWVVGEAAITGKTAQPLLMVASKEDLPKVQALASGFRGLVSVGHPDGLPNVQLT